MLLAAEKGQLELYVKLAELGADINKTDRVSKAYLLAFAVVSFSYELSSFNQDGRTALILASANGYLEGCVKLVELGADLNSADKVSETCFCAKCFAPVSSLCSFSFVS